MLEKRKQTSHTPQPAKKAKTSDLKAPASAPAKVSAAALNTPTDEKGYVAALRAFIQQNGPSKLATLGSKVKRPPKSPKLKHFLETHKDIFKYNGTTDTVSLA